MQSSHIAWTYASSSHWTGFCCGAWVPHPVSACWAPLPQPWTEPQTPQGSWKVTVPLHSTHRAWTCSDVPPTSYRDMSAVSLSSRTVRAHSLPGDPPPPASKVRLPFPDLSGVVVVGMAGLNTAVSHCLQGCLAGRGTSSFPAPACAAPPGRSTFWTRVRAPRTPGRRKSRCPEVLWARRREVASQQGGCECVLGTMLGIGAPWSRLLLSSAWPRFTVKIRMKNLRLCS